MGCSEAKDTFACLVKTDAAVLEVANLDINLSGFSGTFVTVPVIDGDFIVERPVQTILRGKLNGVCIPAFTLCKVLLRLKVDFVFQNVYLAVTNTFEGLSFVSKTIVANQNLTEYVTQLMPQFNEKQIQQAVKTYTGIGLNTVYDQAVAIMGECELSDCRFLCSS